MIIKPSNILKVKHQVHGFLFVAEITWPARGCSSWRSRRKSFGYGTGSVVRGTCADVHVPSRCFMCCFSTYQSVDTWYVFRSLCTCASDSFFNLHSEIHYFCYCIKVVRSSVPWLFAKNPWSTRVGRLSLMASKFLQAWISGSDVRSARPLKSTAHFVIRVILYPSRSDRDVCSLMWCSNIIVVQANVWAGCRIHLSRRPWRWYVHTSGGKLRCMAAGC